MNLKHVARIFVSFFFLSNAFALTVGGGSTDQVVGSATPVAHVSAIKAKNTSHNIRFQIKERGITFFFDGSTVDGKNMLATLLTAQSTDSEIVLTIDACTGSECPVLEVTLGSVLIP